MYFLPNGQTVLEVCHVLSWGLKFRCMTFPLYRNSGVFLTNISQANNTGFSYDLTHNMIIVNSNSQNVHVFTHERVLHTL